MSSSRSIVFGSSSDESIVVGQMSSMAVNRPSRSQSSMKSPDVYSSTMRPMTSAICSRAGSPMSRPSSTSSRYL